MARTIWRIRDGRTRIVKTWVAGLALIFTGCLSEAPDSISGINGWNDYEDRLQSTASEFTYHTLLDQNLAVDMWQEAGVALRVPQPFQPVPNAVGIMSEEHAFSREVLGEPLPGVLGSWQAMLPGQEGQPPQSAYLFLVSNQHLWSHSRNSAMAFHQALVEDVLAELSGLSRLPIASEWKSENHTGHGQPYAVATFQAKLPKTKTPADFTLFLFQHGVNQRRDEIKVALLFVIPQDAIFAGSSSDVDPKTLTAQTLHITPRPMDAP